MSRLTLAFLILIGSLSSFPSLSLSADKSITKIIVRVVARDAQVIGSGVGGAAVRIKNVETGEILAEGRQQGGTGSTQRIMVEPRPRGGTIYGTSGSASFRAEIPLDRPTRVEVYAEAPLSYPHSIQRGSKTVTLLPGKHLLGEGLIIELNGLIVNVQSPPPKIGLRRGEPVSVKAEVRML